MSILQEYEMIRRHIGEKEYRRIVLYLSLKPQFVLSDIYYRRAIYQKYEEWKNEFFPTKEREDFFWSLEPWGGKDATGQYQYPPEEVKAWHMMIDEEGTVYYITHEEIPQLHVWCTADKLTNHLRSLENQKNK